MRTKPKTSAPVTTIGISSLLTVFIILCLVTFACLSLSTAKSDYEFAHKNADHKTSYYDTCNRAEDKINDYLNGKTSDTSWTIPIDDDTVLSVEIVPEGTESYTIRKWKVVSTADHDYNRSMNLIQPKRSGK